MSKTLSLIAAAALIAAVALFAGVSGTATAQEAPAQCEAAPGQAFIGQTASAQSGLAIMQATGATIFQWVPEGSPVTRDYRVERVRVVYNRDMTIVAVTCG